MMPDQMKVGIIGWPVDHSRSPLIHNRWLAAHNIAAHYERCPIDPADDFRTHLEGLAEQGFVGANVTIPHKQNAFAAMDTLDSTAEKLGAVNTITFRNSQMHGSNTDGGGFIASLEAGAPSDEWRHQPALILGAGGAARAILVALYAAGVPHIRLTNRTESHADLLKPLCDARLHIEPWEARAALAEGCGLVVNTTRLGMHDAPPLDMGLDNLAAGAVVSDIVYTPLETDLLKRAAAKGLVAIDGLGMLMHQAALSFDTWFGVRPSVDAELRAALLADLNK